jgi:anti-sigma regulatory factor (Ser/Thr protein kinase)
VPTAPGFEHPALVYADVDAFLGSVGPFVAEGLERGEPVFAAVGLEEVEALRSELGTDAGAILEDTTEWHPIPATRLRAFHVFVQDRLRAGASRIRLVGEPAWPEAPDEFIREWARYESVLNAVLAPFPVTLVCTYPASRLAPSIVRNAGRTHPVMGLDAGARPSAAFENPESLVASWTFPLDRPPARAERMPEPIDLSRARAFAVDRAIRAGLRPDRARDLEIAVHEVVTNAVTHGGGAATLRTWVDRGAGGGYLVVQIDDRGPGIADPLAGYRPPGAGHDRGRGLWLARQAVDLLEIVSTETGTAVRIHLRLGPA